MATLAKTIYESDKEAFKPKFRGETFRYNLSNARTIVEGLKEAGVDFVANVPDSLNHYVNKFIIEDPHFTSVTATREDEAVAIAAGAQMGGRKACVVMEASGYGNAANCIARLNILQRTPLLFITSHVPGLGEAWSYHCETRFMNPILEALQIPHFVLYDIAHAKRMIREAQISIDGQKLPVALTVPTNIYFDF